MMGFPHLPVQERIVCSGCQFGKPHQLKFHQSDYMSCEPLELVHSDVFKPVNSPSVRGRRFMVTVIDNYSRFLWVAFMKEKSEALTKFKAFQIEAKKLTGRRVKILCSNNGGEYVSHELNECLNDCKIRRQITCSYTPQQHGVSERKNRHLAETYGSIMHSKNVRGRFWAKAMKNSAFVVNRLPQKNLGYILPHKKLFNENPNVVSFVSLAVFAFYWFPALNNTNLKRKQTNSSLLAITMKRKDGSVVTL